MKNKIYNLLFKTGDAEIRAIEKSKFPMSSFFPIIELTRGRKSKNDSIGLISKRLKKLKAIFKGQKICIDLTTSLDLSSPEIDLLYDCSNGYENWISFLTKLKNENIFKEIVPTILVDIEDVDIESNLLIQVKNLRDNFNHIIYRNSISDEGCYEDIALIKNEILKHPDLKFTFILDCGYLPVGALNNNIELAKIRIGKIKSLIPSTKFIVASTSFPRYVGDIGNDDNDTFPINENYLYQEISEIYPTIEYGDYGSINPIRNDTIVMSRGWIPRIDIPTNLGIFYYRIRRSHYSNDYAETYIAVSRKVLSDPRFPNDMNNNWGIKQIVNCSQGYSPGSSPSFWISVRMSIFIELQLRNL